MKYVFHHLGLGDHIICNGMVRYLKDLHEEIGVFCKPSYYKNVEYMFRDDEKIKVIPVGEHSDVENYIVDNNIQSDTITVKYIGVPGKTFDVCFYDFLNIPFNNRFSRFFFQRNHEMESISYQELNPNDEPYIYIHDDSSRGYSIDRKRIRTDLKIIENSKKFLMFDMIKILENATEIHTMQTGMKDLINSYILEKPKIFLHWYVRKYGNELQSVGINNTIRID